MFGRDLATKLRLKSDRESKYFNGNAVVSLQIRLIIPDNTSIKETLKMFIKTIAQQEDDINDLRMSMKAMTLESAAAHNSIKAWTKELLNDSQKYLIENIIESKEQIQNFVYNVQGFADNSFQSKGLKANEISVPQPGIRALGGKLDSVL